MAEDRLNPASVKAIAAEYLHNRIKRSHPQQEAVAVLVAGQPGAGKTDLVSTIIAELWLRGG